MVEAASITRTASSTDGQPSSGCQGVLRGDGPGGQGGPPPPPGDTITGVVHLHLSMARGVLTVTGEFVPDSQGTDLESVVSCMFMLGFNGQVPEQQMNLLPTRWVVPADLWDRSRMFAMISDALPRHIPFTSVANYTGATSMLRLSRDWSSTSSGSPGWLRCTPTTLALTPASPGQAGGRSAYRYRNL